MTRKIGKRSW